jgi:hypothetical protein
VIRCHKSDLEQRCRERGYTLDEVLACVVARDGDQWTVNVDHPDYPRTSRFPPQQLPSGGPGTELKKLLARVGITASPDCSCNRVAAEMDAWGPDECEKPDRLDYIVAAMRENAAKRGLPFLDVAGRMLVRRAIRNARRLTAASQSQHGTEAAKADAG